MMNSDQAPTFLIEAENSLKAIRGGILVFLQDGKALSDLDNAYRQVQGLKLSAEAAGRHTIADLLSSFEGEFASIIGSAPANSAEGPHRLLDALNLIEAEIVSAKPDDFSDDISSFLDESFENLQLVKFAGIDDEQPLAGDVEDEDEIEDEFEIDEEMVEIFREEAEELLQSIGENVAVLAKEPNNSDALLEIRRCAHTFKGSAGIVGLKKPSRLAHRVEDLLDHVADNGIEGTESIFRLLFNATDCLAAMTNGEDRPQFDERVAALYREFDECMESLKAGSDKGSESADQVPAPIAGPVAAIEPVPVPVMTAPAASVPAKQPSRHVVRVSLEKLDDLASIVRDLVTGRTVFEQRLAELEQQIEDLHNSTRRLQRSGSKLETDFEANMLGGMPATTGLRSLAPARFAATRTDDEFDMLEFDRYTDFHQTMRELLETTSDNFAINSALDTLRGNLEGLFENQRRLVEDMQDKLQRIRMIEFGTLAARLNRTVRVTCEEEAKQVDLFIEGTSLEIDTQILDSMIEPLMHLLRNAVAHGIESPETRRLLGKPERGRIDLVARNEETHIALTVTDDGRGIAASALTEKAVQQGYLSPESADSLSEDEIFELIFQPGLTTAEKLSHTAGRGVGMNVVRTSIERQQGSITVSSEPQRGTTFTLRLPVSLAVTRVLHVRAARQSFAFPLKLVNEIVEVPAVDVEKALTGNTPLLVGRASLTAVCLSERLGLSAFRPSGATNHTVLVVELNGRSFALITDEIVKPEEIVIKSLGRPLENLKGFLGATILGSGQVVPVLDMAVLFDAGAKATQLKIQPPLVEARTITAMIVDDSPSVRHLNKRVINKAGWNAMVAKDGIDALELLHSAEHLPDVILTDVEMPRMDGYELLASLKKDPRFSGIPVVMITSRSGDKHRQKAVELGVSEYLTKPYDDAKLLDVVKTLTS